MAAQRIGSDEWSRPMDAVRWMLAMQGQDFPGVKWSVGLRVAGATDASVSAALDRGELVRSWLLRGTLQLVAAEDLVWILELVAPRTAMAAARRRAQLELSEADVDRARKAAVAALAGNRGLTRTALLRAIRDDGGVATAGQRGYHLLWALAHQGTLVLGPTEGRQQTFALLDTWLPPPRRLGRDDALAELTLRYLRSHGPATDHDVARWSGLTLRDARRGIDACGHQLTTVVVDEMRYHLMPDTLDATAGRPRAQLLPGFDEYLLGYQDRTPALPAKRAQAIVSGGVFRPTIVIDGCVVGTWRACPIAGGVAIEPTVFDRLSRADRSAVEEAVEAYGSFIGRSARLTRFRQG